MNLADRLTKMTHEDQEERERRASHDFGNNGSHDEDDEDHIGGHDNTYQLTASKQQEPHVSQSSLFVSLLLKKAIVPK
jgi:hypothetical protein